MRPMGVITCSAPMNPSANVTYTHKKFKRAQKEACESNDLQQKQQQQQQQQPPLQQQKEVGERNGKTEASTVPVVSRSTSSYLVGSQPVNGFLPLPAQLPANTTTATTTTPNVGSFVQQHPDAEERKRKTSGGSSSGKQIYEYMHYGMGWSKPSVHDKHKRTHTNERPYSCHQCSIAFKTKSNFLKHTRSRAHALRCDGGGGQDGTDATVESGDNPDVEGDEAAQCSAREGTGQQSHPTDLSITHTTTSHIIPQEEPGREKGSLYKPKSKFRIQYQEEGTVQGQSPPMRRQHSAPLPDTITVDSVTSNPSTYQFLPTSHPSSYSHGAHSSPGPHSPIPANLSKPCLPPLDIGATIRKEEGSSSSSQQNSVVTPRKISHLWKNMKSPSPELVGQHITKLIVENQVIVDTHNPLCLRRYKRQPSIGSSSSESDGSGSGKNRRNSLVDSGYKTSKTSTPCPRAVGSGPPQAQQRERNLSYTSEAPMVERQSSYSPSLPPTPILPLAQPTVTPVSASKPSISIPGITTSYSQSPPILTAPSMTMMDPSLMDGARKQCIAEGPSVVRDVHKTRIMPPDDVSLLRQHPCNPEGSVIKNLLLTARENISNAIDHHEGSVRVAGQAVPLSEVVPNLCVCCRTPFRNHEEWEIHMRHGCGQRLAGGRGTPDSMKSRDGGRWVVRAGNGAGAREQDEALDLQKKPDHHHHPHHHHQHHHHHHQLERERSSSRGSSSGDPPVRRGSQDDPRYRFDSTPVVSRSKSVPEGNLPHNKKRKFSDVEGGQNSSLFLTPVFPGKVHGGCKNEFGMKLSIDEIIKQTKQSNLQLFGGEVQICDGNECKTMRIDPSQQPSPAMDIRIPPQQLGGNISKPEVSVPTSVVVTIAKSGLNSGGTMVQVDSKTSTSSTKTVPSLVNSSLHHEHSGGLPVLSPSVPKAAHSPAIYNTSFSPNFMQYAPNLQLPNLAIPGIPAPDLGSMSFSTYSPRTPSQSSLLHPQTSMTQGLLGSHKQSTSRLTLLPPRPASVTFSSSSKPTSPHPAPQTPLIIHTGSHPMSSTHPPLSEASQHPLVISEKEKDYSKMQHKMPSVGYPSLIPVGDEKVPYVPGIPGPYSQANMVNPHSKNLERNSVSSLSHLSQPPPPPIPYVSPATSISPRPGLVPSPREKSSHLSLARSREAPHSPVRDHSQVPGLLKLHHRTSPKEMTSVRPKASPASNVIPEIKTVTPEIRIHPAVSDSETPEKKQVVAEKPGAVSENKKIDTSQKSETSEPEEFLPPRKRPNFLELKPQPFTPKSSLALIGTTLVSPDTPRPKKSCVQMLLNGSAYTYLGHKVSTKSYFCCIYRQQPMYVPQSTDPKLSMYSNWQIRKPAEDNPLKLSPYQSMSLYESCKYDRAYTIAKPKELNLIQTHSSYWTFKEEKEKTKGKEDDQSKEEVKEVKVEEEKDESPKTSVKEESGPSVKREAEDPNPNPDPRGKGGSQDGDGQERGASTAKRIKIFEGGFKSMEDYTYVRGRGRGRYVCETCGIRCKKPSMLRKHIRTHTDLRPYACVHCSFSFKTKGNLTKHLRSKAHYKRCEEMGIVPVPTVVDDSHLNHRALALQGKLEQEGRSDGMDCDDDDDDEDDDDEEDDDDDDEEDDVMEGGNIQFQDAQGHTSTTSPPPQLPPVQEETRVEVRDEATKDATREGRARGVRSGVLVMHPAISALPTTMSTQPHTSKVVTKVQPQQTTSSGTTGDSPMDLSVKKMAAISLASTVTITTTTTTTTHGADKLLPLKMSLSVGNPSRPSFLPLMSRSSVPPDLRSPVASLSSPATPSTPIREHAFEILSPVTESSSLLKSIYNTTERASHVSSEKQPHVVLDPTKENGSSSFMLQAYLKERAVLDSTIKRHQYKDSSSETSPDSPRTTTIDQFHSTKSNITPNSRHIPGITNTTTTLSSRKAENTKKETYTQQIKGESEALLAGLRNKGNPSPSLSVSSAPTSTTSLTTTTNTTINTNTTNTTTASIITTTTTTTTSISSTTSSSSLPTSSSSLPTTITTTNNNNNNSKSSNDSNKSQVTSISNSLATAITTTSRMPTPPANLTVMNNGGMDTKTAFLVPSGVVPSSLNRLGNDDGKCKCSVCHKEFNRHSQLSIHMNIHYMERPYRCEACAISFRTNGHLQKHKRSVSHFNKVNMNMTFGPPSSDNPRPFKCRDCKIAFRIHGHLAKHLRSKMHIMKLECLGKLPFGTYAEMERSGANLNEIDTTDCDNSLESLKVMATRMYEKDPTKLSCWQTQQQQTHRVRTVSSSSTSSDDYPMQDDQDDPSASHATPPNDDDTEGDEDEEIPVGREAGRSGSGSSPGAVSVSGAGPVHSPRPHTHTHTHISPIEVGSGATAGLVACHLCHEKFLDIEHLSGHLYTVHKVSVTYRNS